ADDKLQEIYENENLEINENNDSSDNNNGSSNSQQTYKSHPLAYHTSRILEDIIDEFKILKINTSKNSIPNTDFNKGELIIIPFIGYSYVLTRFFIPI